jgi:S-adenosylmethionine:diacylglycerol 3-amino-3-carboxypropyl transferase
MPAQSLADTLDQKVFDAIYSRALVYNTCWEDPAVDRQALQLAPSDTVLAISSAGCNVLDYALLGPRRIHAVDANPRQTALLELKIAGIRHLDFESFFAIFGEGRHPRFRDLYGQHLRDDLSPFARDFWDRLNRPRTSPTSRKASSLTPSPLADGPSKSFSAVTFRADFALRLQEKPGSSRASGSAGRTKR